MTLSKSSAAGYGEEGDTNRNGRSWRGRNVSNWGWEGREEAGVLLVEMELQLGMVRDDSGDVHGERKLGIAREAGTWDW